MKYTGKVVYFADWPLMRENVKEEWEKDIKWQFEDAHEIYFPNIECTSIPPFRGHSEEKSYDILLFDWGIASLGNDILEHFCDQILKEAEDCPSRTYIMVSQWSKDAMEDATHEIKDLPANVFLSIDDFAEEFKKLYKIQEEALEE